MAPQQTPLASGGWEFNRAVRALAAEAAMAAPLFGGEKNVHIMEQLVFNFLLVFIEGLLIHTWLGACRVGIWSISGAGKLRRPNYFTWPFKFLAIYFK